MFKRCIMTTSWSQESCDSLSNAEREAEGVLAAQPKSPNSISTPRIDHPSTNRAGAESLPTACHSKRKIWFIVRGVMLAAVTGAVILCFLSVASFGVLGVAVAVACGAAAVGLGRYLLWGQPSAQRAYEEARR